MSAAGSALRRLSQRVAPRTLTLPSRIVAPALSRSLLLPNCTNALKATSAASASRFSTMAALRAAAPPALEKAYDPEIRDLAHYIHHYKIESDLAVWSTPSE